ncbi:polysaccharide biosynthesis/export family protein [Pedobacter frigoris]|uniref:polysaccharide biosynthesis/export family protein n=1 Tax=Pedobacter frigoris TaxID=2571272 RepID=UPI00292E34A3|nr:polysaccharide biosynthesis/export family protein [Pedobacter frigoris]
MTLNLKLNAVSAPKSLLLLCMIAFMCSCSSHKDIPYIQDVSTSQVTRTALSNYSPLIIQPGDQLSINVESKNPEASAVFTNNKQNAGANPNNPMYGYQVAQTGEINLPLIGITKVAGLKTEELAALIQKNVLPFLKDPSVTVKIVNFKISVVGDVMRPNIYASPSERLTVTEALALAGDLNITAMRKTVILVREEKGERIYVPLDLTSKKLFESPYFYLKANDQLIVQPGKLKIAGVDTGYRNASLIISALSVVAITISFFR